MEQLPWEDGAFDVATAVNALQFAADYVDALAEAARVVSPGGVVAICNWGPLEHRDLFAVMDVLRDGPSAAGPVIGDPGELERRRARRRARAARGGRRRRAVRGPRPGGARAARVPGRRAVGGALERLGEAEVRRRVVEAAAPFRRDDGSYRFENRFRYVVAGSVKVNCGG